MKYSLRSLMIGITLFCVLLGGRIEYLRRWAAFHENQARKHAGAEHNSSRAALPDATAVLQHARQYLRFRDAMLQPWTIVDTTLPEVPSEDVQTMADQMVLKDVSYFFEEPKD